jgi:hypothetical protein
MGEWEIAEHVTIDGEHYDDLDIETIRRAHNADIAALTAERDEARAKLDAIESRERYVMYTERLNEIYKQHRNETDTSAAYLAIDALCRQLAAESDEFLERLNAIVAMLEPGESPENYQTPVCGGNHQEQWDRDHAIYHHVRAIAEGREE